MRENFIHLLSNIPCLVSINGKEIGKIDNENNMELDIITKTSNVYVSYTPISQKANAIPYTFLLNTNEQISSDNEYISIIPYPENHYDIIMRPFYYYQIKESKAILNVNVDKYFVSIVSDNLSRITILSGNTILLNITSPKLIEAKAELIKNTLVITGIIDNDTYYLLVIDTTNFDIFYNDICHSIDNDSNCLQCYKKLSNLSHHATVSKINFEDKKKEIYNVYENDKSHNILSPYLIPQAFLECLSLNDENLARTFLSPKISTTPINKFKNFFGEIKEIFLNRHNIKQGKLNYTIFSNEYKNYNFLIENNLIEDIEEIF